MQTDNPGRDWVQFRIKRPRREKRLPVILSLVEVERLIVVTQNIKHRALLALAYSAGLRRQEIQQIKPIDIDSARMFIRRFLQHILPCGFYKIRYFGILAICNIKSKLTQSIRLIGKAVYFPVLEGLTAAEVWSTVSGHDLLGCPKCKIGKLIIKQALA